MYEKVLGLPTKGRSEILATSKGTKTTNLGPLRVEIIIAHNRNV